MSNWKSLPIALTICGIAFVASWSVPIKNISAQQALPAPPIATSQAQAVTLSSPVTSNQGTPATAANAWPVSAQPYPLGATAVETSLSGTTAGVATSLPAVVGKTTFICGYMIQANATAPINGVASLTGITSPFSMLVTVAAAPSVSEQAKNFAPCLPASAPNTLITVTAPAAGTGGNTFVSAWGYQQ